PGGIPVAIVVSTTALSRLMATNPLSPRENAIAFSPLSHQWLRSVPATVLRNATMRRMEGSRCSHTHRPIAAVSRLEAQVTAVVQPFASEGGPMEFPAGQSNA